MRKKLVKIANKQFIHESLLSLGGKVGYQTGTSNYL